MTTFPPTNTKCNFLEPISPDLFSGLVAGPFFMTLETILKSSERLLHWRGPYLISGVTSKTKIPIAIMNHVTNCYRSNLIGGHRAYPFVRRSVIKDNIRLLVLLVVVCDCANYSCAKFVALRQRCSLCTVLSRWYLSTGSAVLNQTQ